MNALEIYVGSNGDATKAMYEHLATFGPLGVVAVNLFRAQKCSARAKKYRGRGFKDEAYARKDWSLQNLCAALEKCAEVASWGWKQDPTQDFHNWVLYVDLPTGQVSFHTAAPHGIRRYAGEWDGTHLSQERIIRFVQSVLCLMEVQREA